jgi:putative pyruvate formate lyase activating enzyme
MNTTEVALTRCELCPRCCGTNRLDGETGYCGAGARMVVAHWGLHFGEEPPISGTTGSGNVFFSPCNLRCVFCQNHQISHGRFGKEVSPKDLADIFFQLKLSGSHNINLVSPTPYVPLIAEAIAIARTQGIAIPFVYNTNAYEKVGTIEMLDGLIDVYLPDLKYWSVPVAGKLSGATDYPGAAMEAVMAMKRQVGDLQVEGGLATRGLLIRHLVLPAHLAGTKKIVHWIKERLGVQTFLSLMAQYQPLHDASLHPALTRRISVPEYEELVDFLIVEGFENVFVQELDSAPLFVPDFTREEPFAEQVAQSSLTRP